MYQDCHRLSRILVWLHHYYYHWFIKKHSNLAARGWIAFKINTEHKKIYWKKNDYRRTLRNIYLSTKGSLRLYGFWLAPSNENMDKIGRLPTYGRIAQLVERQRVYDWGHWFESHSSQFVFVQPKNQILSNQTDDYTLLTFQVKLPETTLAFSIHSLGYTFLNVSAKLRVGLPHIISSVQNVQLHCLSELPDWTFVGVAWCRGGQGEDRGICDVTAGAARYGRVGDIGYGTVEVENRTGSYFRNVFILLGHYAYLDFLCGHWKLGKAFAS